MVKKRTRNLLLVVTLVVASAAIVAWQAWSPGAPTYAADDELASIELPHRLRNGPEHDAALKRTGNPYVLEITKDVTGTGALLYYGARHADDPDDPQIADIRKRWDAFKPTVALCEGRSRGYFVGWPMTTWGGLPEPAWVHYLARESDVPLYSLEPDYAGEVAALLQTFTPEQVALYFTMRVYWSEAAGTADESLALDLLEKRTAVKGLESSLTSIADIDRIWNRDLATHGDWRTLTSEPSGTYLADISTRSRIVRGEHMARVLLHLVANNERVFAVVGSGHVIRQEWALRAALGAQPAFDQPQ